MVMFLLMKKWIINIKKNLLTYFKIMQNKKTEKHSMDFGKKEKVLNYACQTYQLSRPNKVGAVIFSCNLSPNSVRICGVIFIGFLLSVNAFSKYHFSHSSMVFGWHSRISAITAPTLFGRDN